MVGGVAHTSANGAEGDEEGVSLLVLAREVCLAVAGRVEAGREVGMWK